MARQSGLAPVHLALRRNCGAARQRLRHLHHDQLGACCSPRCSACRLELGGRASRAAGDATTRASPRRTWWSTAEAPPSRATRAGSKSCSTSRRRIGYTCWDGSNLSESAVSDLSGGSVKTGALAHGYRFLRVSRVRVILYRWMGRCGCHRVSAGFSACFRATAHTAHGGWVL